MVTKADVSAQILSLISAQDDVTSRGGTVTRTVSDRVNEALELGLEGTKQTLPAAIVAAAGLEWDEDCWSRGGTVTLAGLQRLHDATLVLIERRRKAAERRSRQAAESATRVAAEAAPTAYQLTFDAGAESDTAASPEAPEYLSGAGRRHEPGGPVVEDEFLCRSIAAIIAQALPTHLDGREAILQLRGWGNQWRQIEWIGWWVEHVARGVLQHRLGGDVGPVFRNTEFDFRLGRVFDVKSHVLQAGETIVLNDAGAVDAAVLQTGAIGFIVVAGDATYDDDAGAFYRWHCEFQGKTVKPRTRQSRRRKTGFTPRHVEVVLFKGISALRAGLEVGLLSVMKQGKQQSGAPRPPKYRLHLDCGILPDGVLRIRSPVTGDALGEL